MLTITGYSVELIKDPFGILTGKRYEWMLDIEVAEDDELHSDNGLYVRVIYVVEENKEGMVRYEIFEKTNDKYVDFELEDDEQAVIEAFCKDNLAEATK
ncbi:DUF6509 family protein [Paenibacillus agricola]|uniref:Pullulanase n=1 Tax=Paenibacillus agricola TaxID=2716264 RepID=A0ABX0J863_9BACL|nr:DUF6509 family protein [Paenibacillus agricola]NHN31803.1 pullulanase [Paenibacillus agricola]